MNKRLIRVMTVVFSLALMITTIVTPATAATGSSTEVNYDQVMDTVTKLDDAVEEKKLKKRTKEAIKNDTIDIKGKKLDYSNAKLYEVNETELKAYIIPIKSSNQKFHEISNVTLFYNQEDKVDSYTELHVKESHLGTFQVAYYSNGFELANELTEDTFTTAEEYKKLQSSDESSTPGFQTMAVDWGGIANCLGISWSVGAVLAAVCGGACVLTAGTACLICVGAYLGFDVASVTGCVAGNIS